MGEFQHNVDAKGRLIVPAKYRELLGENFVITRGLDQCLFGYPMNEWNKIEEKLKEMPVTKKDARAFTRFSSQGLRKWNLISKGASIYLPTFCLTPKSKKNASYSVSPIVLKYGRKMHGKRILKNPKNPLMKLPKT